MKEEKDSIELKINPKFQPLFENTDCRYFLLSGGRGSGKSSTIAIFSTYLLSQEIHQKILFTRQTLVAADKSIIPEYIGWTNLMGYEGMYNATNTNIKFSNNNEILFSGIQASSGDQTARLKSIPNVTTFILDEAMELTNEKTFDDINFSFRQKNSKTRIILSFNPDHKSHWIYERFYKSKDPNGSDLPQEFNGIIDNTCYIHTTYLDNIDNLDQDFINEAEKLKNLNLSKYNHHFLGHWCDESSDTLFKQSYIQRKEILPEMKRIVIGVDPAVSNNKNSDETGIIVAGLGVDEYFYILEDASIKGTPTEWANKINDCYNRWNANLIIVERNQGGDLVESNIRTVNKNLPIKSIHAKKGKLLRAEPISSLYEQKRVFHTNYFPKLELQITTYTGSGDSPDRLDAMVYSLIELSEGKRFIKPSFAFEEPKKKEPGQIKIDQHEKDNKVQQPEIDIWKEFDFDDD